MATNTWSEYQAKVPGANGLYAKLRLKNDEPSGDSVTVYYEAIVFNTSSSQWYNSLNETPFKLVIDGQTLYNTSSGNFDVRSGDKSQIINSGSLSVSSKTSIDYNWTFDPRNTYASITGPAVISGYYELPATQIQPATISLASDHVELGQEFRIDIEGKQSNATYKLFYTVGTNRIESGEVNGYKNLAISSSYANQFPNSNQFSVTLELQTLVDGKVQGTTYKTVTVKITASGKPTIGSVGIYDTVNKVASVMGSGNYLSNLSRIRATAINVNLSAGATISKYVYRVKQHPSLEYSYITNGMTLPPVIYPFSGSESMNIQMAVVDSRGLQSDWVDSPTFKMHSYQAPILGVFKASRSGDGKQIIINRNWKVTSLIGGDNEKNSATLKIYIRKKGTQKWELNTGGGSTALNGVNSEAVLSGTYDGTENYEFKVELTDKFNMVSTTALPVPTVALPISVTPINVGIGMVADKSSSAGALQVSERGIDIGGKKLLENKNNNHFEFFNGLCIDTVVNTLPPKSDTTTAQRIPVTFPKAYKVVPAVSLTVVGEGYVGVKSITTTGLNLEFGYATTSLIVTITAIGVLGE